MSYITHSYQEGFFNSNSGSKVVFTGVTPVVFILLINHTRDTLLENRFIKGSVEVSGFLSS